MGFLDKAKTLADQAIAKADVAMNTATTGAGASKQADSYLRDLGVLALLESTGRAPADLAEQRERCLTALGQIEAQGPINLAMGSLAPPPPGAAAGAPPPPGGRAPSKTGLPVSRRGGRIPARLRCPARGPASRAIAVWLTPA